jgi:hypothetical protein
MRDTANDARVDLQKIQKKAQKIGLEKGKKMRERITRPVKWSWCRGKSVEAVKQPKRDGSSAQEQIKEQDRERGLNAT